jgi:uncharacterized protein (UPF0335 family)
MTDQSYRADTAELRQLVQRIESQEQRIADEKDALKEIYEEAKARGYDTKVMRKLIAIRKRDANDIAEEEAILELYKDAVGV